MSKNKIESIFCLAMGGLNLYVGTIALSITNVVIGIICLVIGGLALAGNILFGE